MRRVQADSATLLRQASMTADEYLMHAIVDIDKRLGKGSAKTHPELIAAFTQTAAIDMGSGVIAGAIEDLSETLGSAPRAKAVKKLDQVADKILAALRQAGDDGLSRTAIFNLFGRNLASDQIGRARRLLAEHDEARSQHRPPRGKGRPAEIWVAPLLTELPRGLAGCGRDR